jgi:predicted dehydrogenase
VEKPFQWGIVGTGGIARHFAADLAVLPGAALAGICSRDPEKAKAFQSQFGAARAFADLDAMAADPGIDAIYIATPNSVHADQALQAIGHGKPVLVEKPLATTAADAEHIASASVDRNCFAMEGMWTRFLPAVRAARKLIGDGAIGAITGIEADLSYYRDEDVDGRFFNAALGGGAALDLGVYPLSLALHFLGKPLKVSGRWYASKSGVDMRSEFDLQFAGAEAHLSCGFDRDGANQFVIHGSKAVLRLEAPFLKAQKLARFSPGIFAAMPKGNGVVAKIVSRLPLPGHQVERFPFVGNGLQFEAAAVMEAVRRGATGADFMPLTDSIEVLRIIESVRARKPEPAPLRKIQNVL